MSNVRHFVMIYEHAFDDIGDEYDLTWSQRSWLRYLILDADMDHETGRVEPVTADSLAEASRYSAKAIRGTTKDLADAGVLTYAFPRGHDGWIVVEIDVLDAIVRRSDGTTDKAARKRRAAGRTRPTRKSRPSARNGRSTGANSRDASATSHNGRSSAHNGRSSAHNGRSSARNGRSTGANSGDGDRETDRVSPEPGRTGSGASGPTGGRGAASGPSAGQGRVDHSEAPQAPSPSKPAQPPKPKVRSTLEAFQPFTVRDQVHHSLYGLGRITKVVPSGKAIVARFDGHGEVCMQLADVEVVAPGYSPPPDQTGA